MSSFHCFVYTNVNINLRQNCANVCQENRVSYNWTFTAFDTVKVNGKRVRDSYVWRIKKKNMRL